MIYLLGKELFSARLGLIAALMAALMPGHIEHCRMATRPVLTPLFVAGGLLFAARALSAASDQNRRRRWINLVLCGVTVGLGLHGYEAFRLFPLALATALLWHRAAQRRLLTGLAELAVVAVVALALASPIALFAWNHPAEYFQHVSDSSVLHQLKEDGSIGPYLYKIMNLLIFLIFGLPTVPNLDFPLILPQMAVSLLFASGLVGLIRFKRQDRNDHDGRASGHSRSPARVLLMATLVWMTAPFVLSRFGVFAIRRYFGEMVPFYLLAGGAALAVAGQLRRSCGGPVRWAALAAVGVASVLALVSVGGALDDPETGKAMLPRDQLVVRHGLSQAGDIYLAPGLLRDSYLRKLFLKNSRLNELVVAAPLPQGRVDREAVILANDEPWGEAVRGLFGGAASRVSLKLPGQVKPVSLWQFRLPRKPLAHRRWTPDVGEHRVALVVPRAGVYRFRVAGPGRGLLGFGDDAPQPTAHPDGVPVPLAAGLHRLTLAMQSLDQRLQWRVPESRRWRPVPAGLLWRLPSSLAWAPGSVPSSPLTRAGSHKLASDPAFDHCRVLQDIAPAAGGFVLADLNRIIGRRWSAEGGFAKAAALLDERGVPLENEPSYQADWYKVFSLDADASGIWLLRRRRAEIVRFDRAGRTQSRTRDGLTTPLDIAVDRGKLYIADPGAKAVLVSDARTMAGPRVAVGGVRPVAVAAKNGALAYLDQRRHQLVVARPGGRTVVQLGAVGWRMRLSLSADGRAVVVDPTRAEVLLFDAEGRLMAPAGDPRAVTRHTGQGGERRYPVAAAWDDRSGDLIVVNGPDQVMRFSPKKR